MGCPKKWTNATVCPDFLSIAQKNGREISWLYVNSWGVNKKTDFVCSQAKSLAAYFYAQWRILFLKREKLRTPKQTRFKTFVLLLQPSVKPLDHGKRIALRISVDQLW